MVQTSNGGSDAEGCGEERARGVVYYLGAGLYDPDNVAQADPSDPGRADQRVKVRVIETANRVCLIEWVEQGDLCRALVPVEAVEAGTVHRCDLDMAIPYGVCWEAHLDCPKPEDIARAFRRRGIWTIADLTERLPIALEVARGLLDRVITELFRTVRED